MSLDCKLFPWNFIFWMKKCVKLKWRIYYINLLIFRLLLYIINLIELKYSMSCYSESIEHLIPMKKIEILRRVSLERSWTVAENKELSTLLKNSDFFKSLFGNLKSDQFTNIASHLNEGSFSESEIIYQNNQ